MKILECKKARIYDTGFVDPYFNHEVTVNNHPEDTENNLLRFLMKQNTLGEILFPYNYKWVFLYLLHILFCLLDV